MSKMNSIAQIRNEMENALVDILDHAAEDKAMRFAKAFEAYRDFPRRAETFKRISSTLLYDVMESSVGEILDNERMIHDDAEEMGAAARVQGKPFLSNPYADKYPTLSEAWQRGWTNADNAMRTGT